MFGAKDSGFLVVLVVLWPGIVLNTPYPRGGTPYAFGHHCTP